MGQGKTGGSAGGQGGSAGSIDPFMSFLFGSNWNGGGTSQVGTNPTTTGMTSSPTGLSTTQPTTGMTSSPTGLPTTQPTPTTNSFASPSLTSLMGTVLGGTALNNVNKAMGVQQPTTGMTLQQPVQQPVMQQPVQQPVQQPIAPPDQQTGPTNSELGYTPPDQQGPVAPTEQTPVDTSSYDYNQPVDTSGFDGSNMDFGGDWSF